MYLYTFLHYELNVCSPNRSVAFVVHPDRERNAFVGNGLRIAPHVNRQPYMNCTLLTLKKQYSCMYVCTYVYMYGSKYGSKSIVYVL